MVAPHTLGWTSPTRALPSSGSGSRKNRLQLAQELLNASPMHQWALVSNGKTLRLLRDAATLTRPSYLEFDPGKTPGGRPAPGRICLLPGACCTPAAPGCWAAAQAGANADAATRHRLGSLARSRARRRHPRAQRPARGVTQALLTLGQGFVQHPANHALRQASCKTAA